MGRSIWIHALALVGATALTAQGAVLMVDDDGADCPAASYASIQDAIDAAKAKSTVVVCAGTYDEQLTISKAIRLKGKGGPTVKPSGMATSGTSLSVNATPIKAVATVSAKTTIDGITFDGADGVSSCPSDGSMLAGVWFRGASGVLKNSTIQNVSCAHGTGVFVQSDGAKAVRATLTGNTVTGYYSTGVMVNETGANAVMRGNTVTGGGLVSDHDQNGVQVAYGAKARMTSNTISNNGGTDGSQCSFHAGVLLFNSNGSRLQDNTLSANTGGVLATGDRNVVLNNTVDGSSVGLDGVSVFGDGNKIRGNDITNHSEAGIRMEGTGNSQASNSISGTNTFCSTKTADSDCGAVMETCGQDVVTK